MHPAEEIAALAFRLTRGNGIEANLRDESLCSSCQYDEENYPTSAAAQSRSNNIYKDIRRTRQSALDGCWMCAVLLAATRLWNLSVEEEKGAIGFFIRYDAERFTIHSRTIMPSLQVYSVGKPQVLRFITDTELPATATSPTTANFIAYNLNQCLHTHRACQEYQTRLASSMGGGWPARILRIDSMSRKLQLIDFDPSMASRYTALSYCWGDTEKQLRATSGTLSSLSAGVDISCLPQTLRDAVSVTTSLRTDLIWIDSLCIVQDNTDDWNREAGKMSVVYALALVTIIASSASACDTGFLDHEREGSIHLADVEVEGQTTELRSRLLYDWGHHRGGSQSTEHHSRIWVDPVDTRAWTLQERLLSARFITYTSGEVQWGCRTLNACECGQNLYGKLYHKSQDVENLWFSTLQEYLCRNLTKQTDKLTAIAGIARMTSSAFPGAQYVAGIWITQPTLSRLTVTGLLWYRQFIFSDTKELPTTYTAPSFSWASVIGEVFYLRRESFSPSKAFEEVNFPSRIVEVGKTLESSDPFGRVSVAYLQMAGPVLGGTITSTSRYWTPYQIRVDRVHGNNSSGNFDAKLEKVQLPDGSFTVRRSPWPADDKTPKWNSKARKKGDTPEPDWDGEIEVRLLPLMIEKRNRLGTGFSYEANCLVLARSVEHPGYERIGVYTALRLANIAELEAEEEETRIY